MFDAALKATAQALGIRIPDYRFHKHSGQAVVTVFGRDVYLGVHGSVESRDKYERVISELVASRGVDPAVRARLKIQDLILLYWGHATQYYPGRTCESTIKSPLKRLRKWFADEPVATFGPLKLKAYRQLLLGEVGTEGRKLSRQYINECVAQVRAMIKWGVGEELVSPSVLHGLQSVDGLRWGRTTAREPEPVKPVDDAVVEATLLHLCPTVADMVRVQRLTGMRPGEVCAMTVAEVMDAAEVLDPPQRSNILVVEAPAYGRGEYRATELRMAIVAAFSGFLAARRETEATQPGSACVIHTGFWGCGAYGGNHVLMTAIQILAAEAAGVDTLVYYLWDEHGQARFRQGKDLAAELLSQAPTYESEALIASILSRKFRWGTGNGT